MENNKNRVYDPRHIRIIATVMTTILVIIIISLSVGLPHVLAKQPPGVSTDDSHSADPIIASVREKGNRGAESQSNSNWPYKMARKAIRDSKWEPKEAAETIRGSKREPNRREYISSPSAAVSSDSSACPAVGRSVLKKGGSAVDAAIATLFCQGVTDPHRSGIGGGFFMLIYIRANATAYALDAREVAPLASNPNMFDEKRNASFRGGLSIAVPGEVKGLWEAHKRFGVLPWAELVDYSVVLARWGTEVDGHGNLGESLERYQDVVFADPVMKEVYTNSRKVLEEGDIMKNMRLSKTLEIISQEGPDPLYKGRLAQQIVQEIQEAGGIITVQDLKEYRPIWREAVRTREGNLTLLTMPPPSCGAILAHILNIMEGYEMGPDDLGNTESQILMLHRLTEAFKHAYGMRTQLGDPKYVDIKKLFANLVSKEFARQVREKIDDNQTSNDATVYGPIVQQVMDAGTTHVSVVSGNGDAVSVTSSINQNFGSGIMSQATGIIFNDHMDDFSTLTTGQSATSPSPANSIAPGKRPLSTMSPTILVDQMGDVRLVIGAAGGIRIATTISQVILRHLWLGQSLKSAINFPRIHHQLDPNVLEYEDSLPEELVSGLLHRGHVMRDVKPGIKTVVTAIARNPNGTLVAYSDDRKGWGASYEHHKLIIP